MLFAVAVLFALSATAVRKTDVRLSSGTGLAHVWFPDSTDGPSRAVVLCPGGRYANLQMESEGFQWAEYFSRKGYVAVVLRYTMPHGDPSKPVADAEETVRMLRANASRWNIDPGRVGIIGFSAGGHLASYVATNSRGDARPDFQCLFYPVITMDTTFTHMPSRENLIGKSPSAADVRKYSNELNVDSAAPRAFIVANGDDVKVPPRNAVSYYLALQANGVSASLHVYPTGAHGWGFGGRKFTSRRQFMAEFEAWLDSF